MLHFSACQMHSCCHFPSNFTHIMGGRYLITGKHFNIILLFFFSSHKSKGISPGTGGHKEVIFCIILIAPLNHCV